MRKAFSFYRSHYEQMKLLNKTQTADLMIGICEVQFLEVNIDDISFKDKMTQLVWTGIKHGIKASVDGYISKKGINPTPLARGLARGSENVLNPLEQGEEKEKEKEKEKGQYVFNFALKRKTKYDNLPKEYQDNLYGACMLIDGKENRYNDFLVACRANGYSYMHFPMAYMKWDEAGDYKNFTTKPIPTLGDEWKEVSLGQGEVLAVNTVTYETRRGSIS